MKIITEHNIKHNKTEITTNKNTTKLNQTNTTQTQQIQKHNKTA